MRPPSGAHTEARGLCLVTPLPVPDLERLVVLVDSEDLAALRALAERCIDDARLRNQLVELTYMAAATHRPWTSAA